MPRTASTTARTDFVAAFIKLRSAKGRKVPRPDSWTSAQRKISLDLAPYLGFQWRLRLRALHRGKKFAALASKCCVSNSCACKRLLCPHCVSSCIVQRKSAIPQVHLLFLITPKYARSGQLGHLTNISTRSGHPSQTDSS